MCCPWIRVPVQVVSTTSNHRHWLLVDDTNRGFPAMLGSLAPNVSGLPEVGALPQIGTTTPRPPQGGPNTGPTGPMLHIGPRTGPMSNPLRRWGWTSPSMSRVRWGRLLLMNFGQRESIPTYSNTIQSKFNLNQIIQEFLSLMEFRMKEQLCGVLDTRANLANFPFNQSFNKFYSFYFSLAPLKKYFWLGMITYRIGL